jgi:FAD/FMN-containing dehydrogenase/Fe-S oxidoreductase
MVQPARFARTDAPRGERFGSHAWSEESRAALEADLRRVVDGEVRFDGGSRAMYTTGGSNYRQVPIGVVVPRHAEDVVRALDVCRRHHAPVLGRGGGTSLAGQCCNIAVVFDCSKYMNGILSLDPDARRARVQPGLILDHLRHAAEGHHLTFGPDPATHTHCTLGGMIGNNSCGVHSLMAGKTDDNVESLDILTYDGACLRVGAMADADVEAAIRRGGREAEIVSALRVFRDRYADAIRSGFPRIPRRVSGYNLPWLLPENGFNVARALVGSESTCVMILDADVRLVASPQYRTLVALGYPDIYIAADEVLRVLEHEPIGLEGMDDRLVDDIRHIGVEQAALKQMPEGRGWLLVEFGGVDRDEADARANALVDALRMSGSRATSRVFDDREHEREIWRVREAGLGATAHVTSDRPTWEGWEDSAVPPEQLGRYLRDLRKLLDRYEYIGDFYGHFGQGCLHTRINFDLFTAEGIRKFRSFISEAADLVVGYGGSLSGEHGDGQSRAELLPKMFGAELIRAFKEFKAIWDPECRMNPGKIVDPYRIDENLRLGSDYNPPTVVTYFKYPEEHGNFARAPLRCVGVGECRRTDRGTMCPSFQVTREEMHSTRGRAHLLFEMLEGDPLQGGWQSEEVKEALDLCLACKGCKSECPVHVDMATYKAEFLAHYYEQHWRPRTAWAFGLIHWWARFGARMPVLVNFVTHAPVLREVAKWISGMPRARQIPAFAERTFLDWFETRRGRTRSADAGDRRVVLWPDTFNNHFHPETAIAAVEALESAGFTVSVPSAPVCCGRPLYDYGLLPLATRMLTRVLATLADDIRSGTPVVVLEPSCAAVFRDEMGNLLPGREDARRLKDQVFLMSEFVQRHRDRFGLGSLDGRVLFHGHCHQKSIFGTKDDRALLQSLGVSVDAPDTGCCGMAGSFGFEADHYDVSMKVGERVLLPAVRTAAPDTIIVADGFSCREQIAQATSRRALHTAQVVRLAQIVRGRVAALPERQMTIDHAARTAERLPAYAAAALIGVGAVLAFAARPARAKTRVLAST